MLAFFTKSACHFDISGATSVLPAPTRGPDELLLADPLPEEELLFDELPQAATARAATATVTVAVKRWITGFSF
jgi:hypothetical protein